MIRFAGYFFLVATFLPAALVGDAGVLIPSGSSEPDPSKLTLEEMDVDVRIDGQTARVAIRQIFRSHASGVQEGQWVFALPAGAAVSDFAVWDDVTRIPGVILERRRARQIYEELKAQAIDPGLLQQGEGDADEARRASQFSAQVVPIPGFGFKRVEVEYHERVAVENLGTRFAVPLRPEAYQAQTAARFRARVEIVSEHELRNVRGVGGAFPLEWSLREPHRAVAEFAGRNVRFTEDLAVEYELVPDAANPLKLLTFRDPSPVRPHLTARRPPIPERPLGFFLASALLDAPGPGAEAPPRTVVALFDASLSMQWEKLDRSYRALETLLLALRPADRFQVIVFESELRPFSDGLEAGEVATVERALDFVKSLPIRGGTRLDAALAAGLDRAAGGVGEKYLVLLGDGGATKGSVRNALVLEAFEQRLAALPPSSRPRLFAFGVGDDANLPLLRMLAENNGVFEHVRSTEPIDFKLNAFLSKIGRRPLDRLTLAAEPSANLDLVYPLEAARFAGSVASWVGRYLEPAAEAVFRLTGSGFDAEVRSPLPESNLNHPHLPRTWARARVDALLAQIEREGEDEALTDEIIYWSKRFKFVTPYTSFLAAPRSLLRPRVIRPGDPVLRVRTDETIDSVTALFPFGLTKQLKRLPEEDVWQTRFLAPKDMPDGDHEVRLVLRDREGRVYREKKTFTILSQPPTVRVDLPKREFRRGERVELRVDASRTTRTLTARLYGVAPVALRWNALEKTNTGALTIPADLPPGEYPLRLTAEDFAHNLAVEEVTVAVLP